jgi:hypothetical protein
MEVGVKTVKLHEKIDGNLIFDQFEVLMEVGHIEENRDLLCLSFIFLAHFVPDVGSIEIQDALVVFSDFLEDALVLFGFPSQVQLFFYFVA